MWNKVKVTNAGVTMQKGSTIEIISMMVLQTETQVDCSKCWNNPLEFQFSPSVSIDRKH